MTARIIAFPHRLATPASHASRSSTSPAADWHPLQDQPLDYVEPVRIARAMSDPVDLYGNFRFEDEPSVSEWVHLARGAAVGLLFVGLAVLVLLHGGGSF